MANTNHKVKRIATEQFRDDMINSAPNITARARMCGCGPHAVQAVQDRRPVPTLILDEMQRRLYHQGDVSMKTRMDILMHAKRVNQTSAISKLRAVAQIVQDYRSKFKLTLRMRYYWVFPPQSVVADLSRALDSAYKCLVQIHRECPEYDRIVFKYAPELLAQIMESETGAKQEKSKERQSFNMSEFSPETRQKAEQEDRS